MTPPTVIVALPMLGSNTKTATLLTNINQFQGFPAYKTMAS